jgi:hypothetical protein
MATGATASFAGECPANKVSPMAGPSRRHPPG